ncbi:hypothetical protein [Rubellicoccus peritrichatus]|uniref:Beta-ketoacyl synthase C-terminal domain-containing protein n=1 Tax=Rubellicoccus peritrichatus TaxID=3080537 RepID=A0AAQ3QSE2_9BACT|nr:hypothetical protein [Puniceicoccus sp. CR14]WOO42323.1 hypothetical protein RZN69_04420 [Puniceicoccus sp. CR14]
MLPAVYLKDYDCISPFGRVGDTWRSLCADGRALALYPVPERDDDSVPLALINPIEETEEGRWLKPSLDLLSGVSGNPWGDERHPVIVTSSNFGIGQLFAHTNVDPEMPLSSASPARAVERIAEACCWGKNRFIISNVCISAQLGMIHAARLLHADLADEVLVFSFDFLSPFVVGGFHSLRILNDAFPRPFSKGEISSIGLGDGAAYAVLDRSNQSELRLSPGVTWYESHHMTGNDPSGSGFKQIMESIGEVVQGKQVWLKGHGTGTVEAGSLEADAASRAFPDAPLVSWKGSLGHTLGSCGLIELAIAAKAMTEGVVPGNSQTGPETLNTAVAREAFSARDFDGVILTSSAFGGAHASHFLSRA